MDNWSQRRLGDDQTAVPTASRQIGRHLSGVERPDGRPVAGRVGPASACWPMRYHAHVVAARADDVVIGIGAWLFDQVSSGWTISVMLSEPVGPVGLRVLGTEPVTIDQMSWACKDSAHVIATDIELYNGNVALRQRVDRASRDSRNEVLLWGSNPNARWPKSSQAVHYTPSNAARLFKTHAAIAAGLARGSAVAQETFHRLSRHDVARRPMATGTAGDTLRKPTNRPSLYDLALTR